MKRTHFRLAVFAALVLMLVGGNVLAGTSCTYIGHPFDEPEFTGVITLKQPVVIGNANFYSSGYYYEGGVGMDDLDIWLNNWNAGRPPADAVIPEPSTAAVLGVIGIAGLCRRRR